MYNHCTLEARIANAPSLQKTKNGIPFTMLRLACPRNQKADGKAESDFFSCMVWRSQAEFVVNNFQKGSLILVAGKLENIPKQDPNGAYQDDVILNAAEVHFCGYGRKSDSSNSNER